MCRLGVTVAALAAVLAACAGVDERHAEQMMLGQQYYMNGKFYESIGRFQAAFEHASSNRERYQATLGVANASAEYGLLIYEYAERLLRDNKRAAGMKKWQEADKWHDDAARAFYKCLELRPSDTIANRGLGDLFYRRSTSFSILPYLEDEKGYELRRKERDEAVKQYGIVLSSERGDITKPEHGPDCKSSHIHRYLALALFTRSDWDKNDCQEARRHMIVYLNYLKWAHQSVLDGVKAVEDQEKLDKEKRLEALRKQIAETRALLGDQLKGLKETYVFWQTENKVRGQLQKVEELLAHGASKTTREQLEAERDKLKNEVKKLPPKEKYETWMLAAHREIEALNLLSQQYDEAVQAAKKKAKPAPPAPENDKGESKVQDPPSSYRP